MDDRAYEQTFRAEDAHWWFVSTQALVIELIRRHGGGGRLRILDAGCGTGRLAQRLSELGTVDGLELSPLGLARCRRRGLRRLVRADLNRVPLGHEIYDVVVCVDVLYHRWIRDDRAVLRQLADCLVPGGLLIVHNPALSALASEHDRSVLARQRYSESQQRRRVEAASASVIHSGYRFAALLPLLWTAKKLGLMAQAKAGDWTLPPRPINRILSGVMAVENRLFHRARLPLGSSVLTVARKRITEATRFSPQSMLMLCSLAEMV